MVDDNLPVGLPSTPVTTSTSLDLLLQAYHANAPQEDPDPTTAPISEKLVPLLEKSLYGYIPPSEIKKLQEKAERPSNATAAKPVKINSELYYAIAPQGIAKDKTLGFIGHAIVKAVQPLITVWNQLVVADSAYKDQEMKKHPEDKSIKDQHLIIPVTDSCELDVSDLHNALGLALMILGNANAQINQYRHDNFRPYLH